MKTYEEFSHFCAGKLNADLELMQTERSAVVRRLLILRLILGLMILGILGIMFLAEMLTESIEENTFLLVISVLIAISYLMIMIFIFMKQKKVRADFVIKFKNKIISSIVKFFDVSLSYYPEKFIPLNEFASSGLIDRRIERYYGDDYVEGKIGQTAFRFSEVHAFVEEGSDDKKRYVEVFGGIFFIGDFNKNFKGRTYVLPDKIEKTFGRFAKFFQSLSKSRGQLVKLEDIEFEKEFAVYSDDQIEARYILSTSLMQRILEFKRKAGSDIMMAFKESCIYMAIPIKGNLFEPKIFGKLVSEDTLRKYYADLNIAISSIEDLNLNLRIWSKE
ncbi:MAG: DUF3137 domain-containing protein [Candidatus Kapabacteria bacterium]|nr:DUF3137 domain-containing protein [Ignavibacteriota bacterium]MCW5884667.1 DUF3137 domain-containing protein [Candidatus Kapabacteria bacterium]